MQMCIKRSPRPDTYHVAPAFPSLSQVLLGVQSGLKGRAWQEQVIFTWLQILRILRFFDILVIFATFVKLVVPLSPSQISVGKRNKRDMNIPRSFNVLPVMTKDQQ